MEISSMLFVFQTTELISQSLQPSQNPAKDPKRNSWARHLHPNPPTTLRFGSLLPNWWTFPPHKSHLRRGGRTWYPDSNRSYTWTGHIGKIELHNGPHFIPKSSANIAKITIPFQSCSSFDWVGRHRPNVVKTEKSNTPSLTSRHEQSATRDHTWRDCLLS